MLLESKSVCDFAKIPPLVAAAIAERHQSWARLADSRSKSWIAELIAMVYRSGVSRKLMLDFVKRLEGGEMHSVTLRDLMKDVYGVDVGLYSYGACFVPGLFPRNSSVGNYCSIAEGIRVYRRNHPVTFLSQHPFFYNQRLGLVTEDAIDNVEDNPIVIGNDVWLGSSVTILPNCKRIGDGAVIGAGSVVSRDVPSFAIYAGNPARLVRERYSADVKELIEQSRWWSLPLDRLLEAAGELLFQPVTRSDLEVFLLRLEELSAKKP